MADDKPVSENPVTTAHEQMKATLQPYWDRYSQYSVTNPAGNHKHFALLTLAKNVWLGLREVEDSLEVSPPDDVEEILNIPWAAFDGYIDLLNQSEAALAITSAD